MENEDKENLSLFHKFLSLLNILYQNFIQNFSKWQVLIKKLGDWEVQVTEVRANFHMSFKGSWD